MRTTLHIEDDLFLRAKRVAAESGRTLTKVIEDALRLALDQRQVPRPRVRVRLPTMKGRGLQPGVDLDDSSALLDRMEGLDGPR